MDAQHNRGHSISRAGSSTNRPENYFSHAAFIDLAVRQEETKSNSLRATYYFLYRVFRATAVWLRIKWQTPAKSCA